MNSEESVVLTMEDFAEMQIKDPTKPKIVKEVLEYTIDGVFLRTWESVRKAALHYNTPDSSLRNVCCGRYSFSRKTGTIFTYRGEDISERLKKVNKRELELSIHTYTNKEIWEYTLGGRFLCKWPAATLAAKANKVSASKIYNCCKGKRLFVDKRIYLYSDNDIKQRVKEVKAELYRLSKKRPKYREVDEYTLDGKFIKGYPSASAASRELNIHVSDITRCCNGWDKYEGSRFTCKGRIFLWIGSSISDRLELIKQKKK